MNKNKKYGFTLIELLAVIVILSVIALITTPLILNVINDAKKSAAVDSAYEYLKAVEYSGSISEITSNSGLSDGIYKVSDLADKVNVKGTKPTYGTITIEKGVAVKANLCINGYIVSYDGNKAESISNCTETEDTTGPDIIIGTIKGTTSSLTINFIANDNETGIKSTKCFYSTDESYNLEGKIEDNACKLTNLNDNTLYNYKIEAINNGGIKSEVTGSATTGNFESIEIEISPSDWSSSKTVTIKGSTSGATLEYKIVNGTTVKQDWTAYTGEITIDWASNVNTPTYIYARLNDGVNISETSNFTITKIDVTEPEASLSATTYTDQVMLNATCTDLESGISKYEYSKDNGTTWVSNGTNSTYVFKDLNTETNYIFKVRCTNNVSLTKEESITKTTNAIIEPTLTTTSGLASSKDVTIKFNGTNIVDPSYYVKGTVSSISSINVTESCGTETNPSTCEQITSTTTLAANTWYKVSSDVVLTVTENGSFYAATKDSKNLKAGATLTITSITKPASDIYYNNSTYTNGDITVQEAIEELYKKLS